MLVDSFDVSNRGSLKPNAGKGGKGVRGTSSQAQETTEGHALQTSLSKRGVCSAVN